MLDYYQALKLQLVNIKQYLSIFAFLYGFIILFALFFLYVNAFKIDSYFSFVLVGLVFSFLQLSNILFIIQNLNILSDKNIVTNFDQLFRIFYPYSLKYIILLFIYLSLLTVGFFLFIIPVLFIFPAYYIMGNILVFYNASIKESFKLTYSYLKKSWLDTIFISFSFSIFIILLILPFIYFDVIIALLLLMPILTFIINSFSTSLFLSLKD